MRLITHTPRTVAPGAAARGSLLGRTVVAIACFAGAAFLLWRMTRIDAISFAQVVVPGFLCVSTAMVLIVLAVLTLVRPDALRGTDGPS